LEEQNENRAKYLGIWCTWRILLRDIIKVDDGLGLKEKFCYPLLKNFD
jgi:hypothetical protein